MPDSFLFDPNEIAGRIIDKQSNLADDPCILCGLYRKCKSPKMQPFGWGEKGILIIGEAPGEEDDKSNKPFVDESGILLRDVLHNIGINMDRDCVRTNVIQCHPTGYKYPYDIAEYCYDRLEKQIEEMKPKLIICLGQKAAARILQTSIVPALAEENYNMVQGDVYPVRRYGAWASLNYHPNYVMKDKDERIDMFYDGLEKALSYLNKPFPKSLILENYDYTKIFIEDKAEQAYIFYQMISNSTNSISFDYETSGILPYEKDAKIFLVSFSFDNYNYVLPIYPLDKKIKKLMQEFLTSDIPKIAQNLKFEEQWSRVIFGCEVNNWYWDTMTTAHILDERGGKGANKTGLAYLTYKVTGDEYKDIIDVANIENELKVNRKNVIKYSMLDAQSTYLIAQQQKEEVKRLSMEYSVDFFMDGQVAFAEMEFNGVKIDLNTYKQFNDEVERKIIDNLKYTFDCKIGRLFEKKKGRQFKFNKKIAAEDLKYLFFDLLKLQPLSRTTKTQSPQVDVGFLKHLEESADGDVVNFVTNIMELGRLQKLKGTYLDSIPKYVDPNGFIHPSLNLNFVDTFRSSCDSPNMQNAPKRDKYMKKFRSLFIPRFDYLLDVDYSGAEVVIQAMLAHDKNLIKAVNSGQDIHRYWASRLYQIPVNEVTEIQRDTNHAKGVFVFGEFYGSYYKTIAERLGLSETHVKQVEKEFYDLYYGVNAWQESKVKEYQDCGYITTPLGFRRHAPLSRNQIVNTPIQATAFHCLLDACIRAIPIMKKRGLKSLMVWQVHDEIILDVVESEIDTICNIVDECMLNKPDWKFTEGVKMSNEWKIGKNWYSLEPLFDDGDEDIGTSLTEEEYVYQMQDEIQRHEGG